MAGDTILTTVGADAMVRLLKAGLLYFKFGEGGFVLSDEAIEVIEASASGTEDTYDYTVTGGDFAINGVNPGIKTFQLNGENEDYFPVGTQISVEGSTGNDGVYTVVSANNSGGNTLIVVNEAIPSATADGDLYVTHLPIARALAGGGADPTHHALVVEEWNGGAAVQTITDTTGEGNLTGDGTGTVNYKNGLLHVEFAVDVTAGNSVRIRFKYHDVRQLAGSIGEPLEDLLAATSPLAADGNHELFSYQKSFGGGTPPDTDAVITDRGDGYGTIRCTVKMREHEGIDDGRAASWGGVPFYFEVGVYTITGILVSYATFDKTRHTGGNIVRHTISFVI